MTGNINIGPTPKTRAEAAHLDRADPLALARKRFTLPEGLIYLDGHSLGPASAGALNRCREAATEEWAHGLIRSWNDAGWFDLPRKVGGRVARLIGVPAPDVIMCDSISVNIFKLAAAALPFAGARHLIVEEDEFPTDQYILEGLGHLTGTPLTRTGPNGGVEAVAKLGGVLVKSVVNYRTAEVADIAAGEEAARRSGGLVIWDLSHATGLLDLKLEEWGARLAVGCTYKYVNGGPGSPGFIYASHELPGLASPLSGWMGHAVPFQFDKTYAPTEGAARFAAGTPGILSLSALDGALEAFDGVDLADIQAKARALGDFCLARMSALGLESISPQSAHRGGHVSVLHQQGYAVIQALIAANVIADFRAPDAMRFGFSPLYLSFAEVFDAMDKLQEILGSGSWDQPEFHRKAAVT